MELVFEEIAGNIVRHGVPQGGDVHVEISVSFDTGRILMLFSDDGIAFDPCGRSAALLPKSLEEAPDGGFGLTIVRRVATSMQYERTAIHNCLTVTLAAL